MNKPMATTMSVIAPLGWISIIRMGLVRASLGAVVVLTTSVLNRVMVVELALPAILPGALVALHYVVQLMRPRIGHSSDAGGRRTPRIVGGMATLALGGFLAACGTVLMGTIFVGCDACGISLCFDWLGCRGRRNIVTGLIGQASGTVASCRRSNHRLDDDDFRLCSDSGRRRQTA